ncbi:hypothetical protein Ocin01_12998 [Orchesella cincta]|uniref:Chitin-binding type-2 domain-containing protein n=1 Tax=Orchesella cincta TaxID=48709 RepID=A0A1D2MLB2_ORCCI|nr:hypothetical protein Ocin01_12998 [Orchesella cincta]
MATKKSAIAFSSSAESEKTGEPIVTVLDEDGEEGNGTTTNVTLTGNPQIDYVHDPNLPRELNGYNLSDYPFFSRVPKTINFSCDGRKDGFYSNVEHKCQVYHHCLYETRHDFLCANYTAFDQRTFICQFVSEVDCPNSHMFFHRNKDLYITKTTTTIAPVYDRGLYERRRPQKKPKSRLRPAADDDGGADTQQQTTAAPDDAAPAAPPPPKRKDVDYADEEYYDDDDYGDYAVRRPARPRRRFRKCRNGRRRGRRCRGRRPAPVYDYDDYTYDDDYDYAYYDGARPRKPGKKRRPQNAIPAGTSQVTSTSSSETPAPTSTTSSTTTTTTTTRRPPTTTTTEAPTGPLDSESVTFLQNQRDELLAKTRRPSPFLRPGFRPSRQNDKSRTTTSTSTTSTTTTTTERAKPTTTGTTTTTTEVPQYIYDYEYYEDDSPVVEASSTTTTTTTAKPSYFRGKIRGGNSAAALLEKQRVPQSIQVRVTEDSGTNTNTIRRRDNSQVQTPTRVATLPSSSTTSTTTTTTSTPPSTQTPNRPSRFWQRKSTVKIVSTTATPSTTTTTAAPYYQDYQDYEDTDVADPQPSVQPQTAPAAPLQQSSKFQPLLHPTHQYGTSPAAVSQRPQNYANTASSPSQPPSTSPRGHGSSGSSLSSSSYARPNKPYTMQQYSQSSSSSSSSSINNNNSNSNNNNYNTNSYHRQRSPTPSVPKPEFISLVDEDYNNPYVSPVAVAPTSPSSTRLHGGSQGGASSGYHQHPIRFFEQQHQPPAFLFGAASEYNSPQFAFPPRNYPSPSNFQPYGHSTRRFSAHFV